MRSFIEKDKLTDSIENESIDVVIDLVAGEELGRPA